jgi:hypothetical protein
MENLRKALSPYATRLRSVRLGPFTWAALAAFALVASIQVFASSGEYDPGAEPTLADQKSWSAPGRYFLNCQATGGAHCISVDKDLGVFAKKNYTVTFRSNKLDAGRYKLRFDYRNYQGTLPPGYHFDVDVRLNGKGIAGRTISLAANGKGPWVFQRTVEVPEGESTISIAWKNDRELRGSETNFGVISAALISLDAEAFTARNDVARERDLSAYRSALARYVTTEGSYPKQQHAAPITADSTLVRSLHGYLDTFLDDPIPDVRDYYYVSDGKRYGICADLEGKRGVRLEGGPSGMRKVAGSAAECQLLN